LCRSGWLAFTRSICPRKTRCRTNRAAICRRICGVCVDSNSQQGLTCDGPINSTNINVVGGYTGTGCSPTPNVGVNPAPDPLSYLPAPVVPVGCNYTNLQIGQGQTSQTDPNAASYTGLVAQTLRVNGSGAAFTFRSNYAALGDGAPFLQTALLE
jgi:hypothetical protein